MRFQRLLLLVVGLLLAACNTGTAVNTLYKSALSDGQQESCPVSQPSETAFIPPEPWPAKPPDEDRFWLGDPGLWTALPKDGSWSQLALGEKFFWWSEEFDVTKDETPNLVVSARRLDGDSPDFSGTEATNAYHPTFDWAMLIGVDLPSPGCWEITGQYNAHELTFVLSVP